MPAASADLAVDAFSSDARYLPLGTSQKRVYGHSGCLNGRFRLFFAYSEGF